MNLHDATENLSKVLSPFSNFVNKILESMRKLVSQIWSAFKKQFSKCKNRKVVYLIYHTKKYRTRKKNLHRILRC